MNSQLLKFFKELLNRLSIKSPKFFKVLQLFGASLTFAGYVPSMLQRWFGVEVPGPTITMCEDIGKYAAGFFAASLLPTATKGVAQTIEGSMVQVTDEMKLPYTAAIEKKKVEDTVPEPPVIPEVPDPNGNEIPKRD